MVAAEQLPSAPPQRRRRQRQPICHAAAHGRAWALRSAGVAALMWSTAVARCLNSICEVSPDVGSGLSMLQRAAGRADAAAEDRRRLLQGGGARRRSPEEGDALLPPQAPLPGPEPLPPAVSPMEVEESPAQASSEQWVEAPTEATSTNAPPGVEKSASQTTAFPGARTLAMRFPASEALVKAAASGDWLGAPRSGNWVLDDSRPILVTFTVFPNARLGWSDGAYTSEPVNVPHSLFTVKLPMIADGRKLYENSFALTNSDVALNIYRMGFGIPCKMSNISFDLPSGAPSTAHTDRRGRPQFVATGLERLRGASQFEASSWLGGSEVGWGTGDNNVNVMSPYVYYRRELRIRTLHRASHVGVGAWSVASSGDDFLRLFFPPQGTQVEGMLIDADLEVTAWMQTIARKPVAPLAAQSPPPEVVVFWWRDFGDQTTPLTKDFRRDAMSYQNGENVWISMRILRAGVAPYLPPGCTLDGEEGIISLVRWKPADILMPWVKNRTGPILLEYNELSVFVPVRLDGVSYMYPLTVLSDEDIAMMTGRDFIGLPKKLANATYTITPSLSPFSSGLDGGTVSADVSRHGTSAFKLTGRLAVVNSSQPMVGVDANGADTPPVLCMATTQYDWDPSLSRPWWQPTHGIQHVFERRALTDVQVELGSAASEPLTRWFYGQPTGAGYVRMDQDWLLSQGGAAMKPVDENGYKEWWRRSYSVLYM